jgi:hypothetical protein
MAEVLSIQDIRERYDGEWLLISYAELDEDLNVVRGEVVAHSPDRDQIYGDLLAVKDKPVAIEYVGAIPEDLAVIL